MSLKDLYEKHEQEPVDNSQIDTLNAVKEIKVNDFEKKYGKQNFMIVFSIVVAMFVFSIWQIKKLWLDDTILAFQCPTTPSLDGAVRLPRLQKTSDQDYERLVRGFVRKYLRARYPKNSAEAKFMYKYVADVSLSPTKEDFLGRIQELDDVAKDLDAGNVISIYPNSKKILIREKSSGVWNVEVPVRRVNFVGTKGDERIEPVIKMEVVQEDPSHSQSNSGLYVSSYRVVYMPDSVSQKEIVIEER